LSEHDDNAQPEQGKANGDDKGAAPKKRSRVRRIVKWTLLVLLVLVIVLVGLIAWVATTRSGLNFAWGQIGPRLPDGIEVASVEGRLIGPLEVRGVRVEAETMNLSVNAADLDWTASELLSATVHVRNLAVRGVNYEVTKVVDTPEPEPEEPAEPFSLPDAIDLPVTVQIDNVALDDIAATTAPDAEPFVVDTARLANARLDDESWRIESLTGHGPMFDVDAQARLNPRGGYATNLSLNAALRLPDLAPVEVDGEIEGDLTDLGVRVQVAAPYNVTLDGRVTDALDNLALDATLRLDNTRLPAIREDLPQGGVTATIGAKGPIEALDVNLDVDADSADYGRAALTSALRYTGDTVVIDRLNLSSPDIAGTLEAKGQVALAEGNAMDLSVDWADLQWPLSGTPDYRSGSGTVRLTGEMTDYELATNLAWQVVGQTEGKLSLDGRGSMEAFELTRLDISGGPGDISGNAAIRWAPALDVTAHLDGEHINPGAVVADVPGDFNLVADVRAKQDGEQIVAHIDKLTARGSLRRQPLRLDAKAQYLGDHVLVDRFDLVSGATDAKISGRFGWTPDAVLDGRWTIDSSDLSTAWPTLAGSLQSRGTVKGRVAAPNVDATLAARNIAVDDNRVARADLTARVDWSGNSRSNVVLDIAGVNAGGQAIDSVDLRMNGTPAAHSITANVDSDIATADVGLDGALNKKTMSWRYSLKQLKAAYGELAPWTLATTASGAVSANSQSIENACLTSGDARVCLRGRHNDRVSTAHIDLSDFAYDYARIYFPEGLDIDGSVSGTIDASMPAGGDPDVDARLNTSAGSVSMTQPDESVVRIVDMEPGTLTLRMQRSALNAAVDLPLGRTGGIKADVAVAPGAAPLTERALNGSVNLDIQRLSVMEKLSPEVDQFDGRITGELDLGGTIARPTVLGDIALNASRVVLVTPGLVLTDLRLGATGRGDAIDIDATAKSGGGTLTANGAIALNDDGQDVDLAIRGERFQVVNIPDATAYISPDLKVSVTPTRVDVEGSVTVPQASITPRDLPASGVTTVSGDQVIVTDEQPDAATEAITRAIHADVQVILGDKVSIEGFGLSANLTGDLRVVQQPGDVTTGTGEIQIVDGAYRAYGQNLDIQEGRILFAGGPVSEPGLDIRAARYPAEDVTVGVEVRGSVETPRLTLFSEPAMGQSEQLSWLLLGRPLDGANSQQSSLVARAALALGNNRANQTLENVGDRLGVDDIGIGAGAGESSDNAAFKVGKYLSPKLYVSYGIGLFNPVSTLSLRYTLSSRWRLETQSSSVSTGGDLIYSIDR
jgi:translocation and assembly module TamB